MKKNSLTILLYHGVTSTSSKGIENYSKKHLLASNFESQIKFVKENCNVLSMDDVVDIHLSESDYPDNAVAVTFDDGFRNNYTVAGPILDKYSVPATFYITSGIINSNIMFWVDQLEDTINNSFEEEIEVLLSTASRFSLRTEDEKISSLTSIKNYCKTQNKNEKDRVVQEVIAQCKFEPSTSSSQNYEKLSWKELVVMGSNPLFTIGAHSMYHDILPSFTSKDQLMLDIELSLKLLKYHLNREIKHYSYPEGQQIHFNDDIINLLKDFGIVCSPSAIHGINFNKEYDLFNLRRVMVGFNGVEFPLH